MALPAWQRLPEYDVPCMVLHLFRNLKEGEFVGLDYFPGY